MINRDRLVSTFIDLAKIDSPSHHEDEIAEDLVRRLKELRLDVETDSYGNIIAGDGGENPLLLSPTWTQWSLGAASSPRSLVIVLCRTARPSSEATARPE